MAGLQLVDGKNACFALMRAGLKGCNAVAVTTDGKQPALVAHDPFAISIGAILHGLSFRENRYVIH